MKKQASLNEVGSLSLILTVTISTLITPASSTSDLVINNPTDHNHRNILPGGIRICSLKNYSREKIHFLDTTYILMNHSVTLIFESPCFKKKHSIKFKTKIGFEKMSWENILVIDSTTDGLVINSVIQSTTDGRVINSENGIEYSEKDFMELNSEIRKSTDCITIINILEEDKHGWFMGKCDLDFERKYVNLCSLDPYFSESKNELVIKPLRTTVTIKTHFCDEQVHITKFNPHDFERDLDIMDSWFRFDYNVTKLIFDTNIRISISGISVDYWKYDTSGCNEKPTFEFIGVNEKKRLCNSYENTYLVENPVYYENPVYTSKTRFINFPYIIIIMMIILGKAICGYGVYKRRQARLISFTTTRIVNASEDLSPVGSNIIIVSSNQQSASQSHSQRQPSEDLPPAYNELQHTDINPPGYEDACKSKSLLPPGYEVACRDNEGFQIERETSSSINSPQ